MLGILLRPKESLKRNILGIKHKMPEAPSNGELILTIPRGQDIPEILMEWIT